MEGTSLLPSPLCQVGAVGFDVREASGGTSVKEEGRGADRAGLGDTARDGLRDGREGEAGGQGGSSVSLRTGAGARAELFVGTTPPNCLCSPGTRGRSRRPRPDARGPREPPAAPWPGCGPKPKVPAQYLSLSCVHLRTSPSLTRTAAAALAAQ